MKKISIIGSTGSIGRSTLKVAKHLGDQVQVCALAAKSNIDLLEEQAHEFDPSLIAVFDPDKAKELKKRLFDKEILSGMDGIKAVAQHPDVDLVVSAMTGTRGLEPTLAAIQAGKDIGLANKEALVSGGNLVISLVKEKGVKLIPIDSEHSAIFQCLEGEEKINVGKIILTASGGPFRTWELEKLKKITIEEALNHPTWKMGPKVTIDSSTLMNKGLEVIEAHWLFGVSFDQIEVVIHPQSVIHSLVEFIDGSILAQMSVPTMIIPIQYALTYPERKKGLLPPFDFMKNSNFEFYNPDFNKFRCLKLAFEAIKEGKSMSCYMNAANEILVERFLQHEIKWTDIAHKLEALMQKHRTSPLSNIDDVLAVDQQARSEAKFV